MKTGNAATTSARPTANPERLKRNMETLLLGAGEKVRLRIVWINSSILT
jgi:hypothetical protein